MTLGLIAFLLLCSALISGSEVAFFSLNPTDLEELDSDRGLCPDSYEWCDALGTCIPNNEPCGKYK